MDIYQDIERATHIPFVDDNAKFYRRKQPKFKPAPRKPRNVHLLEEISQDYYSEQERMPDEPRTINPIEIATAIRMAHGTISCSKEEVEEFWRARQTNSSPQKHSEDNAAFDFVKRSNSKKTSSSNSDCGDLSENGKSDLTGQIEKGKEEETVLKSCKLHRNAAIKGLIKGHMITVKELTVPDEKNCLTTGNSAGSIKTEVNQDNRLVENAKGSTYVPSPYDEDILVTSLQAYGIDESKYKHIDFTVPRLGTKTTVTPLEYHLYGIDDDSFNFVQKKPSGEKK